MYYLVNVDHNSMARNSADVTMKGFKKCCISSAVGLMMIYCGMAVKKMGMLTERMRKMKALTVKLETVILVGGKGR
jgi:hypothetical protein